MSERQTPGYVCFDLRTYFEHPDDSSLGRIGVLTDVAFDREEGALLVRGGMSDGALHDSLAAQVKPGANKIMRLPPDMAFGQATVAGWNQPELAEPIGLIAGQIGSSRNPESEMTDRQTEVCLRMGALALGILLRETPRKLMSFRDPAHLMFGATILKRAEKQLGRFIYDS